MPYKCPDQHILFDQGAALLPDVGKQNVNIYLSGQKATTGVFHGEILIRWKERGSTGKPITASAVELLHFHLAHSSNQ